MGRTLAMIVVLALATAAPHFARAAAVSEDAQIAAYVAAEGNSARSAALEHNALAASAKRAKRQGAVLTLALAGKRAALRLADSAECSNDKTIGACKSFRLVGALSDRHCYVVMKGRNDGASYSLIDDRTGRQTLLPGPPQFEPGGQRILVLNNDEMNDGPSIEIWRRAKDAAIMEWKRAIKGDEAASADPSAGKDVAPTAIELAQWAGERIDLTMRYPAMEGHAEFQLTATIARPRGRWQFAMNKPK